MSVGTSGTARMGSVLLPCVLFVVAGCTSDTEVSWTQYNASDNAVNIEVGAAEFTEPVSVVLTSNTGAVELGTGSVDPGGGPVGTLHTITVQVADEYASDIGRASVRLDSGDRGVDEFDLEADATGEGYWVVELTSVGNTDEVRTDSLTFRLWTENTSTTDDSG